MRHVRQRQLKKVNGIVENNRIDLLNQFNPALDKTFKWLRIKVGDKINNIVIFDDKRLTNSTLPNYMKHKHINTK